MNIMFASSFLVKNNFFHNTIIYYPKGPRENYAFQLIVFIC